LFVLDSLFGANIFQRVTRMCKDKFTLISIKYESKMIYIYLIVRPTSQTKIFWLAIIEPVIFCEKVIDTG